MYINYAEYLTNGGTLIESAFNSSIYEAEQKLNLYTNNRLANDTTFSLNVKKCVAKLVDIVYKYNEYVEASTSVSNPIVKSFSNDGVSAEYGGYAGNTTAEDMKQIQDNTERTILKTLQTYLTFEKNQNNEKLLYRGVCR